MSEKFWIWIFPILSIIEAKISDRNCTEKISNDYKFSQRAVNCENLFSESSCLFMYSRAVKQGENIDRNVRCFQNPTTRQLDENLVRMAVNSCPRTCGYCCLTPEYNCANKKNPRIDCSKITEEQCRSELWRPILIEDCPNVCGLCTANGALIKGRDLHANLEESCLSTSVHCNLADPSFAVLLLQRDLRIIATVYIPSSKDITPSSKDVGDSTEITVCKSLISGSCPIQ